MLMFSLSVVDHVRLDSEHVARNYTVHARAAERIVRAVFVARMAIAALLAAAAATAIANLFLGGRGTAIAAALMSAIALCAFAVYATAGLEARLFAHRSFAHRLWLISERYRALLAECADGIVDAQALVTRRNELIEDLYAIYEFGFSTDQDGHEAARLPPVPDERAA
jgi:hypothetical protein